VVTSRLAGGCQVLNLRWIFESPWAKTGVLPHNSTLKMEIAANSQMTFFMVSFLSSIAIHRNFPDEPF
jgi:hypothetical protein